MGVGLKLGNLFQAREGWDDFAGKFCPNQSGGLYQSITSSGTETDVYGYYGRSSEVKSKVGKYTSFI